MMYFRIICSWTAIIWNRNILQH